MKKVLLLISHLIVGLIGFAAGIYLLPILIAPSAPTEAEVSAAASSAQYSATFSRELAGSDHFHWGEGEVSITGSAISLRGEISPGPDYKLYLTKKFVETEPEFEAIKPDAVLIGDIKTFKNFIVALPPSVDIAAYNTLVVWCESFGEFITAAQYQ